MRSAGLLRSLLVGQNVPVVSVVATKLLSASHPLLTRLFSSGEQSFTGWVD